MTLAIHSHCVVLTGIETNHREEDSHDGRRVEDGAAGAARPMSTCLTHTDYWPRSPNQRPAANDSQIRGWFRRLVNPALRQASSRAAARRACQKFGSSTWYPSQDLAKGSRDLLCGQRSARDRRVSGTRSASGRRAYLQPDILISEVDDKIAEADELLIPLPSQPAVRRRVRGDCFTYSASVLGGSSAQ